MARGDVDVRKLTSWLIYIFAVFMIALPLRIQGHPQCLDFRPPFTPVNGPLGFCSNYSDFTCCSTEKDADQLQLYNSILPRLTADAQVQCRGYLKEIICQRCSPYAAHLYDSESTGVEKPLPGLCRAYCNTVQQKCAEMFQYLTTDQNILSVINNQAEFCKRMSVTDVDYCYPDLLTNPVLNSQITYGTATTEGCLCLEEFARNLKNPVVLRSPRDGTGRIFIGQQTGIVHIYYENKTRIAEPFINISVLTTSRQGDERGFLGLTFHPNFTENSKLYIFYSVANNNKQYIRVSELRLMQNDSNKVDRDSERIVIEVEQPYGNHNGGEMLFGVDGYLYLFVGDGGSRADPHNNGQRKDTLLGKVLRIDIDTDDKPNIKYRVPRDNPFVNEAGSRPEIWAYGIRNMWRCDFDEGNRKTGEGRGRIFCGDVGQNAYEEIDIIQKGGNYGWNAREGFECFDRDKCGKIGPEILPIFAYSHQVGKSVTGGHVYRGCQNPNLEGSYIYGDYVRGRLFSLRENKTSGSWENKELLMCGTDTCFNGLVAQYETNILSFGEDEKGEMYMLTTSYASTANSQGKVYKIVDPIRRGDPDECDPRPTTTRASTTSKSTDTTKPVSGVARSQLRIPCYVMLLLVAFITSFH